MHPAIESFIITRKLLEQSIEVDENGNQYCAIKNEDKDVIAANKIYLYNDKLILNFRKEYAPFARALLSEKFKKIKYSHFTHKTTFSIIEQPEILVVFLIDIEDFTKELKSYRERFLKEGGAMTMY